MPRLQLHTVQGAREVEVRVPESQCTHARLGERVVVVYLASDPTVVAITPAVHTALARELALVAAMGGLAFAGVAALLALARVRPEPQ